MRSQPTRLLLIDDHTLFRESLRRLLESESSLSVVGDYSSADAALLALRSGVAFDVALIDYELESNETTENDGLHLVPKIRALCPEAKILMVTAGMATAELIMAVKQLNAGVFLKTEPMAELLLAIERTSQGERWISSRASLLLLSEHEVLPREHGDKARLGERESQVLTGVLEGQTNKEIGTKLNLSESSVKAVLQKLFEKTGVRSRSQLVRYAIETQIDTESSN